MNDSPIFDRLASERDYKRMVEPVKVNIWPKIEQPSEEPKASNKFVAPGAWISKEVPKMSPQPVKMSKTVNPEEAEEMYGCFSGFVHSFVDEFARVYPNAVDISVHTKEETEFGAVTVTVEGFNPGFGANQETIDKARLEYFKSKKKALDEGYGVNLQKPCVEAPDYVSSDTGSFIRDAARKFYEEHPEAVITHIEPEKQDDQSITLHITAQEVQGSKTDEVLTNPDTGVQELHRTVGGEEFHIRGTSSMPPVFRTELKTHELPQDLAGRQLELYKALASPLTTTEGSGHILPETAVPKPLWITDGEVTDEE